MEQQARVTSSKKIASKSDSCHTTLGSNPKTVYGGPRDDESHTGSTALRRRNARNRTDAIPVDSDSKHHGEPRKPPAGPPPRKSPPRRERSRPPSEHPPRRNDMPPPKTHHDNPNRGIVIRDAGRRDVDEERRSRDDGRRSQGGQHKNGEEENRDQGARQPRWMQGSATWRKSQA